MIGIFYPGSRSVVYSSLFYRYMRSLLRSERVYSGTYFIEDGDIVSDTSKHPLKLKAVFTSLPYEILYRDLAEMYLKLGIEPYRQRSSDELIVIAGGPAVTGNPLPALKLVDAILIGEIEDIVQDIIDILVSSEDKTSALKRLAEIPGMLVPGHSPLPVVRHYVKNLDEYLPLDQEIPEDAEPVWGRSFLIESSRGCGRGCRFCMEGYIFRPKRDRSLPALKIMVDRARTSYRRVSFYSLSFFDNPSAEKALEYAVEQGLETSVPSVRVETLTDRRLRLIAMGGQKTLAMAPETGSCRMCRAVNKVIPDDLIIDRAVEAVRQGIKAIKTYLITGFPGESEEDFEETIELSERLAHALKRQGAKLKISLNPFIPKPSTALQWAPMEDVKILRKRIGEMQRRLRRIGNVEVSAYDPRWAVVQTVLGRGGPELAGLIVEWARQGTGLGHWRRAVRIVGIDVSRYLRGMSPEEDPPWHDYVEHPYARTSLLRKEYRMYNMSLGRSSA